MPGCGCHCRDEQIKEKKQREQQEVDLQKALDSEVELLRLQQLAVQEVLSHTEPGVVRADVLNDQEGQLDRENQLRIGENSLAHKSPMSMLLVSRRLRR